MERRARGLLAVTATAQAMLAILFLLQVPWATAIWPFPNTGEMSNIFIASFLLAAAAAVGWCLLVGSDRALVGIALDYVVTMAPLCLVSLALTLDAGGLSSAAFGLVCLVGLAFGAWILRWARGRSWRSSAVAPSLVIAAFVLFSVTLLTVGMLLIMRTPGIIPWSITPQLSVLFGSMFVGSAAYFGYGLVDRRWENAGGQLAGFLAYDIVLIVPVVMQMATGSPSYYGSTSEPLGANLLLYVAVLLLSAILALYYLLFHEHARLQIRRSAVRLLDAASDGQDVAVAGAADTD